MNKFLLSCILSTLLLGCGDSKPTKLEDVEQVFDSANWIVNVYRLGQHISARNFDPLCNTGYGGVDIDHFENSDVVETYQLLCLNQQRASDATETLRNTYNREYGLIKLERKILFDESFDIQAQKKRIVEKFGNDFLSGLKTTIHGEQILTICYGENKTVCKEGSYSRIFADKENQGSSLLIRLSVWKELSRGAMVFELNSPLHQKYNTQAAAREKSERSKKKLSQTKI
ncbi:MAG: hypothetical protein HKN50_07715 [Gammaproteobacteria bacterium]|nr:hypothetical protein [Gammaproteobacteria bacterium]